MIGTNRIDTQTKLKLLVRVKRFVRKIRDVSSTVFASIGQNIIERRMISLQFQKR